MTDPLLLAIDALAVYRFSRLIVADSILDTPRAWLLARWPGDETIFRFDDTVPYSDGNEVMTPYRRLEATGAVVVAVADGEFVATEPRYFGKWLSCIWCVSPYIAAAVVMARSWWDWWQYPALVAALSAVAGIVHQGTSE